MTEQILGHYIDHKEKLLKEFNHTITLMNNWLDSRFGRELGYNLKAEILLEYEKLIPSIPFIEGMRGKPLNSFLIVTAQELAAYKTMKKHGKTAAEAWELCHEAIRLKMAVMPKWKRWLLRFFMFSPLIMAIMNRRAGKKDKAILGYFEIEYLIGKESDFNFGVNYLQCGNLNFLRRHSGEEFAPYVCMSDIALSDAFGWGLIRTQTLADGCSHCDFRFKKGEATQISSKTQEVQKTIEKMNKGSL